MQDAAIKTFLIADVRGWTAFTHEHGDEAAARLATRWAELARAVIEAGGGTLVELRGDEVLAVFDSARAAIRTAVEIQERAVGATIEDPTLPLAVGIGLDAGEAVPVDGGYRGGALNLAARLCSLAAAGEVLVSREVRHLARKVEGLAYAERGTARVKGLDAPVDVIAVRPEAEDPAQDRAFRRALGALGTAVAKGHDERNPYKGLRAFEEADAADFFGREALTDHLVERLAETRFLAVVGPSGSGKSSVVRAGLVPALRRGALPGSEAWPIVEMFPGAYPLEELEGALLRAAADPPPSLLEQLEDGELGLVRALKRIALAADADIVLVVDQLEEAFTLVEDEERRAHFLAVVERAVTDPHSRLRVVATLRADFYDRPLLYSGFAELLRDYVEALVPLTPDAFERAITEPAKRVGATFEPGLLAQMVADVSDEPGALPLLQYALTELYERRDSRVLTQAAYAEMGGISGALAGRAEEIYASLPTPAQDAARQLFLRLVTLGEGVEDTRRRVERTELAAIEVDQEALNEAVDQFGHSRLVSFDRDPRTGVATIEVAHEALLREWGRLRRWIDAAREEVRLHRRLAATTGEWLDAGRDPSYLLRGSNLAQLGTLAGESTIALRDVEREFVEASRAASEHEVARERRQNRLLKILLAGAAGLLLLTIAAGIVAFLQRQSAKHEATVALARQLGAQSVIEPRIDRAMLLAHEAVNLNRSPQTEGALLATLLRSPAAIGTLTLPIDVRPCCALAVGPDGRTLAVSDNTNNVRLVETRTRRVENVLDEFGAQRGVAYTPDGAKLVGWGGSGFPTLEVRDAKTLRILRKLHVSKQFLSTSSDSPPNPFLVSPDGRTVFYVYQAITETGAEGMGYVDRWDLATGRPYPTVAVGARGARAAQLVRGGRELAVVGLHRVTFLTLSTLTVRSRLAIPAGSVGAIDQAASVVATADPSGIVSFVDLRTGKVTPGRGGQTAPIEREELSPDGRILASTASDGSVIAWDTRTARPIERLNGHAGRPLGVAFSRDGRTLYTSSLDGAVFEWDLGTKRRFGVPFATAGAPPAEGDAPLTVPVAVRDDGKQFAVRLGEDRIGIFSVAGPDLVRSIRIGWRFYTFAWSRAGTDIVVAGDGGRTQLVSLRGGGVHVRTLQGLSSTNGFPEGIVAVAFSPDGRMVAAGDVNHTPGQLPRMGRVAIWDTATGRLRWRSGDLGESVTALAFSKDGGMLAAGVQTGRVEILDAGTGRVQRSLQPLGQQALPSALAFSADGTLATGTDAGIVQLWHPGTGAQIGHPTLVAAAPVASISFSPDGETFATAGGSDGFVKLWSTRTQQQFGATFPGDPGQWGNAQYTPDGSRLIVAYQDGSGFLWPVSVEAWETHACAVAGRSFTREEWSRYVGDRPYSKICPG